MRTKGKQFSLLSRCKDVGAQCNADAQTGKLGFVAGAVRRTNLGLGIGVDQLHLRTCGFDLVLERGVWRQYLNAGGNLCRLSAWQREPVKQHDNGAAIGQRAKLLTSLRALRRVRQFERVGCDAVYNAAVGD